MTETLVERLCALAALHEQDHRGIDAHVTLEAASRIEELERALGAISLQDVSFAVGEGKLSADDVLTGVNSILKHRRRALLGEQQ